MYLVLFSARICIVNDIPVLGVAKTKGNRSAKKRRPKERKYDQGVNG